MFKGLVCAAVLLAATAAVASAQEQQWELGVIGGAAFSPNLTVKDAATSASTGFKTGAAIGVYAGQDMYRYFSGEANYLYRVGDAKVEGSGQSAALAAHMHLITGDFLAHFQPRGARFRAFISFGGGVEVLVGTGQESATQPLGDLVALTATREVLPVGEIGAGIKYQIAKHVRFRAQVRDYISGVPQDIIATAPGAAINNSIRQDIVGLASFALTW
jgi:hypothetical protein